jgi:superfamily II DNA/RNA helicase
MSTKFFTNNEENTLIKKFEGVFHHNKNISHFDILVGYFRASGYFRIRKLLDDVKNIRILVGISVDNKIAHAHTLGLEFFHNYEEIKEDFVNKLQDDIEKASYDKDTEVGILQFIDDLINKKITVKAHPNKNIHAKVYILRPEVFNDHTPASVITGSSNLTDAGLGGGKVYNYEFNVLLSDYSDVKFATEEFEMLWAESEEILPIDIENIKEKTYLNDVTPFELYIKLLIEYFGNNIDYNPDSIGNIPKNYKKLSYQIDAVNEGYNMLMKHNGFLLADVVGLGKTVIAAMVANKFLTQNGKDNTKILIVYPPAVEKNWKNTFYDFKLDKHTKFITNGSLKKILDGHQDYWNKEEYDLVIVDEAHKFRNHTIGMFNDLQKITKSPRENLGLVEGIKKKVILVTATPLNNRPEDIFHQIQMFQDARQSTLPITNLTSFFAPLSEEYKKLKRFEKLDVDKLREIYGKIRKYVIEPITIRRTRTDIENIPEYKNDLEGQNIKFPKLNPPKIMVYVMDEKLNVLFHKTVFYLTDEDKLKYSRYQAIAALKKEIQEKYYENAETVSKSLAFIMKTSLIKRLESSFFAFKKSLKSFEKATDNMIKMFENDKVFIAPDANVNSLIEKGWTDDEIELELERLNVNNKKNQTFKSSDFKEGFQESLKKDLKLLKELVKEWDAIANDPKLEVFLSQLTNNFLNNLTNIEGKLVIFSESKDTVDYLADALKKIGREDVLVISANNRRQMYDTIVKNFDANWKIQQQVNDYNILITTEVLAEGVNLHRSNVVIHYDTPWNSTKLMQRIGRVNRIGTKAEEIYNYVFYPSAQGDAQIKLNQTAFMKIQAFHTAFGEDSKVFSTEEVLDTDNIRLFNGAFKEDEDERLKYLYVLRNFQKSNTIWFDKIKKLPLKSRVGRSAKDLKKTQLQNGTAAFLKTEKKFEFYWVDSNNQVNEITPVEAFKIFEADQIEENVGLIDSHFEHIKNALLQFENNEVQFAQNYIDPEALGGVALRAKKFLSDLVKHPKVTEKQKDNIKKIVSLIDKGTYTILPSTIDRLQKRKVNLETALINVDNIVEEYNVDLNAVQKAEKISVEKPVLIISESFV